MKIRLVVAAAIFAGQAAAGAFAQAPLPSGTAQPARALEYRSAFDGYRAYKDAPLRSWREANDDVAALRGHAGHLKTAPADGVAGPSTPAGKSSASVDPPATAKPEPAK